MRKPLVNGRGGRHAVDAEKRNETGIDQHRRDDGRSRCGCGKIGIDADRIERKNLHLATVSHQDKQEGYLQVERIARGYRPCQVRIRQFAARSNGAQQQDTQVSHGDPERTDEYIFPRSLQTPCIAAVVNQPGRTERGGLEKNPGHGDVIGEIDACGRHAKQHQRNVVKLELAQRLAVEVEIALHESHRRNHGHQHKKDRAEQVERKKLRLDLPDTERNDSSGEPGLHQVIECGKNAYSAMLCGQCDKTDNSQRYEQENKHHGISP